MFAQSNFRVDYNKARYDDLNFTAADRQILRELAVQVADIAARPVMAERKLLWTKHNDLEKTRPLILADPEYGWNEIITADQIRCTNNIAQYWEFYLRKLIFWGDRLDDDFIVEAIFDLPHVFSETPWSVANSARHATDKAVVENGGAYHIDAVLEDYAQVSQIIRPELTIDFDKSKYLYGVAREIFDGVLKVRQHSVWYWSLGLTDEYAFLRGMENLLYDFYDEPDNVHRVMKILTEGTLAKIDYLENQGLFHLNNDSTYVGSGGIGWTNELPANGFKGYTRTKDMWLLSESQITIGVSPEMFAEFIWPYQKRIADRYGLLCYGCCEPMDDRIEIVKQASNLRRVSVSPWANKAKMSEHLGADYVYSMKLSPTPLAMATLDESLVRREIAEGLAMTRNNNVEMIMKDNHTLGKNPNNIIRWTQIAREEINKLY
jgi:hypothetical protein